MKNKQAFTLIELLVVVLIIGILASVALPQYNLAVEKTRFIGLLNRTVALRDAEEIYYLANGAYTKDLTALDVELPSGGSFSSDNRVVDYPNGDQISAYIEENGAFVQIEARNIQRGPKRDILLAAAGVHGSNGNTGKIVCYVYNNNTLAHKICKSLNGTLLWETEEQTVYHILK